MSRRRPDERVRAFHAVAGHVERAKRALVGAMPKARRPGTPLAEALHVFEGQIAKAQAAMTGWPSEGLEAEWEECHRALARVAGGAERLRLEAPRLDFEGMAMVLGDLIAPLDVFGTAERRVRAG